MKIDFSKVLMQLDGKTPLQMSGDDPKEFTLGDCAVGALLAPGTVQQTAVEKIRRARLAEIAYDAGEVDVSVEDVVMMRTCIGETYAALIVLRAFTLLGGDNVTALKVVG